jgi:SCF-associated factor 1
MAESVRVPLQNLGTDVLVDYLFPYLSQEDIFAVSLTCRALYRITSNPSVWHDLFFRTFGLQPNPFTIHKWPEMYRWRSRASLYTWGLASGGRLGHVARDVASEYAASGAMPGVCVPKKVEAVESTVVSDIVAGGYSLTILTIKGELYGVGEVKESRPGTVSVAIRRGPGITANSTARDGARPTGSTAAVAAAAAAAHHPAHTIVTNVPLPPLERNPNLRLHHTRLSLEEATRPKLLRPGPEQGREFVSVSCGRHHVIALDSGNDVWIWDDSFTFPGTMAEFAFNSPSRKKIKKLVAGWSFSAAWVEEIGIVIWDHSSVLQHSIHEENTPVDVDYVIVPGTSNICSGTENDIVDLMGGEGCLVYLTRAGQLFAVDTNSLEGVRLATPVRMTSFEDKLADNGRFIKLSGSYNRFAVFSDDDTVIVGHKSETAGREIFEPIVYEQLQHVGCISVAMGDHHSLALLRGGQMFAWGCESKGCGAFGLGRKERVIQEYGAHETRAGVILEKPTPVPVDGYVQAIAAAGWQSAAIISDIATTKAVGKC